MRYLIKENTTKKKAHIWNPKKKDSYCKMYSTGGLGDQSKLKVTSYLNRGVCKNCKERFKQIHGHTPKLTSTQAAIL